MIHNNQQQLLAELLTHPNIESLFQGAFRDLPLIYQDDIRVPILEVLNGFAELPEAIDKALNKLDTTHAATWNVVVEIEKLIDLFSIDLEDYDCLIPPEIIQAIKEQHTKASDVKHSLESLTTELEDIEAVLESAEEWR